MTIEVLSVCEGVKGISFDDFDSSNAFTLEFLFDFKNALVDVLNDDSVKVIVISGSASVFSTGFRKEDILEPEEREHLKASLDEILDLIFISPKVFITSVSGHALGGAFALVLSSDIVLASDNAVFGFPEISVGEVPLCGIDLLLKHQGKAKASDILMSGRNILAKEAEYLGIISRQVPSGNLYAETVSLASRLASFPLESLMIIKEAIKNL